MATDAVPDSTHETDVTIGVQSTTDGVIIDAMLRSSGESMHVVAVHSRRLELLQHRAYSTAEGQMAARRDGYGDDDGIAVGSGRCS